MAEKVDTTTLAGVTESITKLRELVRALGADDPTPADRPAAPDADSILRDSVRRADASFRSTTGWMVGAVGAIAIVLFGSGPFLVERQPSGTADWPVALGLGVVAIGFALVIHAVSRVYEPENASLGELHAKFSALGHGSGPGELAELKSIIEGPEGGAHLGPGCATVKELIERIEELQRSHLDAAGVAAAATVRHEAETSRLALTTKALAAHDDRIGSLLGSRDETQITVQAERTELLDRLFGERHDLANDHQVTNEREGVAFSARRDADEDLAVVEASLDVYETHRAIVMSEAWIAEKRAVFRSARRRLVCGAVLTLLGGTFYLTSVTGDAPDTPADETPAPVTTVAADG